jgi:subfamily B ATP-binding cassette protein MsbA
MADLASLVAEVVRGHRVVKAFGMEAFEYRRFQEGSRRHLRTNLRAQMLANASGPVVEILAVTGAAALLVYAGRTIRAGELTASDFVTFLTALLAMYEPIRKVNKVNLMLQQAIAAGERVAGLIEVPIDVAEAPRPRAMPRVERGIAYDGVRFAYDREPVLLDFDLDIRAGEIIALVGPSGAGKTTVVNLLPRFFDPDEGRIAIDGVDVRELSLRNLRSLIGIVTQETILFNDSIRRNIAYGTLLRHGTIFVGFSRQQRILRSMLESMVGAGGDEPDRLTLVTRALTGAYYVIPSADRLAALAASGAA